MRVKFNGEELDIEFSTSLDFFKSASKNENDVWIVNGSATKENIKTHENDELFCIERNTLPLKDTLDTMTRARHTPKLHDKPRNGHVAVCDLGGLGSHVTINLTRSGVGYLKLIDFDAVEPSNLNRQVCRVSDLGKFKAEALKEQVSEMNPYTKTEICTLKINEENLPDLFKDMDIACEAFDDALVKAMIAQNFHRFYKDTTLICAPGLAGYGDSNSIQTRKIVKNFYVCGDSVNGAKVGNELIAPCINICAGHQSNLVLELLADKK